ncbi:MAG TPA: STAS domain-containing protein [Burkholderiaceae bacterium]|nr:STAS domain-containing protein [Burkholderiaceae bacterium]
MDLLSRESGSVRIVAPKGRLDHAHAQAFLAALSPHLADCKAGGVAIVLDFSEVVYISSVGLRALMVAAKQVTEQSGRIAIAVLTPVVAEVFQVSHFNLVFRIFDTVQAAVVDMAP